MIIKQIPTDYGVDANCHAIKYISIDSIGNVTASIASYVTKQAYLEGRPPIENTSCQIIRGVDLNSMLRDIEEDILTKEKFIGGTLE